MGFLGSKGVTRVSRKDEVPPCETEQEARTARARGVGQGWGRGLMTALGRAPRSELIQMGSRMTTEPSQARPAACCACNKTGRRGCFHRRTENAGAVSSARQRAQNRGRGPQPARGSHALRSLPEPGRGRAAWGPPFLISHSTVCPLEASVPHRPC